MRMLAIKPDHIPDAVADNMRAFFHTRGEACRAIAAMLNAWPGMKLTPYWEHMTHKRHVEMTLPLPEKQDAEA